MTTMGIEALSSIAALAAPPLQPTVNATSQASPGFGSLVTQGLDQVNRQLLSSQVDLQQLAVGGAENLHQIMIRMEETRLSFQLAMQVRNRLLESYQELMKMPV